LRTFELREQQILVLLLRTLLMELKWRQASIRTTKPRELISKSKLLVEAKVRVA
jgi:hypothetical protein